MAVRAAEQVLNPTFAVEKKIALVVGASIFVAACAHVSLPLPFTPVPMSLVNFGVLLAGLLLGSRLGAVAMALYLVEGALGLPVFAPGPLVGAARLLGPTAGFLIAYPLVAFIAGKVFERARSFRGALLGCGAAETVLFAGGVSWLMVLTHLSFSAALQQAVLWFIPGEIIKTFAAAGIATVWSRKTSHRDTEAPRFTEET